MIQSEVELFSTLFERMAFAAFPVISEICGMGKYIQPEALLPDVTISSESAATSVYNSKMASVRTRITLECHLFSFLQRGEKFVSYAGGSVRIRPTQFIFLPSGNCLMSEKLADNGEYHSRMLFCGHEMLAAFFQDNFLEVAAVEADKINRIPVALGYDSFLKGFVDSLALLDHAGPAITNPMLRVKVQELLLYLCDKDPGLIPYFKSFSHDAAEEAQLRKAVMTNIESSITIPELAFLCHMSLSTFKRKFARVFDTSPKQWFLQQKMERAAGMLKNEGVKVSDIYVRLGYENLSSFIQAFKQYHGTTPKRFQGLD